MEAVILALVATIGGCFLVQIFLARPDAWRDRRRACGRACRRVRLFVAIGILGATVMPHNLYLHSALVQTRRIGSDVGEQGDGLPLLPDRFGDRAERGVFRQRGDPGLERGGLSPPRRGGRDASRRRTELLPAFLGRAAPILFGDRASVRRAELDLDGNAGRADRDGGVSPPADRPLAAAAGDPLDRPGAAVLVIVLAGEALDAAASDLSQVILSLQLSFAVIPLIHFTSNRRNMGAFATPWWGQVLALGRGRR